MRLLKRDKDGGMSFTKDLSDAELPAHPYAILSHTWGSDAEEVTYQDILNGKGTTKPGVGSAKTRFCINQTRRDELEYFWIDTCCIDKSSSAELDKSLRSMFRWYAKAEICYVYLSGLSFGQEELGADWETAFASHRWFKRGWTLQELIAPATVEFFSADGRRLGTRLSLEKQINEITHIPIAALRGKALTEFSVVERKQWQEGRETREPEDLVYSLLGLLDVSMPVLYGEGRVQAWRRLESAINETQKGARHVAFSINFHLSGVVETQHFVARKGELEEMRKWLTSDGRRQYVVLQGLGGIGKTQLAIAYALRHRDDYSAIFWPDATSEDSLKSSFVRMAKRIVQVYPSATGLAGLDLQQNMDAVVDGVHVWLNSDKNNRWLTICDNYDNPKVPGNNDLAAYDLRRYLPDSHQGSVLITTRSSEVTFGHYMRMKKLDELDSLQILECWIGRGELAQDSGAVQLAGKLDGLPLALATAGAYLRENAVTFEKYLEFFEKSWAKLQALSPSLSTYENRTMFSTWQISFEQIEQRSTIAANLLRLWAYFDHQDLWFELLKRLSKRVVEWMGRLVIDELTFHATMQVLCRHGLVEAKVATEHGVESPGYSVHPVVHAWLSAVLNTRYDHDLARATRKCVASHVHAAYEQNRYSLERRLLGHVNNCASNDSDEIGNDPDLAGAYHTFGILYANQGKPAKAEEMYMRALRVREKALGADHLQTLTIVHNLSSLYCNQGKLKEAEEMLMRVLKGREKALGANHLLTLAATHNLGSLYIDQGKLVEAEEMFLRALKGEEKALGAHHPNTLATINNLGSLYNNQGRPAEAEEMCRRALRGKEKALGADHPSTLETVHNFGHLYSNQGKPVEAEEMYRRALKGREKTLGADHPLTLKTVVALCDLSIDQMRIDDSKALLKRAMQEYERLSPSLKASVATLGSRLSKMAENSSERQVEVLS